MITHTQLGPLPALAAAILLVLASCKKDSGQTSENRFASLLFDASSPAAREALSTPVSFRLTEANYEQWERAQSFLDGLPRSAFVSASGSEGNAIDRAVQTLEASPRARTAIERTGLTVRDFVLETIALAQASEAQTGRLPAGVNVPPEDVQFVQRYQSRIMLARTPRTGAARGDTYDQTDTTSIGAESNTNDQGASVPLLDSATVRERGQESDSVARDRQVPEQPRAPTDTSRDTVPSEPQSSWSTTSKGPQTPMVPAH